NHKPHNHPTPIHPYHLSATGVGGIVRDIISMGARPVAVMDQLRFGAVDHPDTARVVHGVVAGVVLAQLSAFPYYF
ncbi:Phosphoribosylformylglycinamidine synthase 2, partial [human gut metagenome]